MTHSRDAVDAALRPTPPVRPAQTKTKMSVFDTSKIRRHNTQLAVAEATKAAEDDAVAHTVVGSVSKGECQMINRVLLHSTSMKGNLDAVPHACTTAEEGDAPVPYRPSYMFGLLARRATKNAHAVQWPEGTIQQRDLGVPSCGGAFTPSTRLVSIRRGRGWFLF